MLDLVLRVAELERPRLVVHFLPGSVFCEVSLYFKLYPNSCEYIFMFLFCITEHSKEEYNKTCRQYHPHRLNPCRPAAMDKTIVDVEEAVMTSREALERMGYEIGNFLDYVKTWDPKGKYGKGKKQETGKQQGKGKA